MVELVLATGNPDKQKEIVALLGDLPITIRTLNEFEPLPPIIEDGETCEANAIKKATVIANHTGLLALADDTGLAVDALGGRPGVYAARYAGEHATYQDNCRKLLEELQGVPVGKRAARFLTVIALAEPTDSVDVVEGVLDGTIAETVSGTDGFGYDPVFFVPELGKTLAQITLEEKNQISHRGRALAKVKDVLRQKIQQTIESGRSAAR
ncbi:MAG: XTP/dITP diphosphatase [Nitrospinae bacterium]|nr:XTP/dITP diphosphatase [Nitrospinota bacterium]